MFEVGQKLWFVSSQNRVQESEVTVSKVGRVWAHLDNGYRCDHFGEVDGGVYSSPGRCYVNQEAYQLAQDRKNAWAKFKRDLEYKHMPESLTIETLAQISATLDLKL